MPQAEAALLKAYHALRESVVLKEHTGPLWSASLITAQSNSLDLSINPDEFVPFYAAKWI